MSKGTLNPFKKASTTQFTIMSGPGEEQVSLAVRKFTKEPEHTVQFTLGCVRQSLNVRINSMTAEGGPDKWILRGHIVGHPELSGNFEIYHDTRRRSGGKFILLS